MKKFETIISQWLNWCWHWHELASSRDFRNVLFGKFD